MALMDHISYDKYLLGYLHVSYAGSDKHSHYLIKDMYRRTSKGQSTVVDDSVNIFSKHICEKPIPRLIQPVIITP